MICLYEWRICFGNNWLSAHLFVNTMLHCCNHNIFNINGDWQFNILKLLIVTTFVVLPNLFSLSFVSQSLRFSQEIVLLSFSDIIDTTIRRSRSTSRIYVASPIQVNSFNFVYNTSEHQIYFKNFDTFSLIKFAHLSLLVRIII